MDLSHHTPPNAMTITRFGVAAPVLAGCGSAPGKSTAQPATSSTASAGPTVSGSSGSPTPAASAAAPANTRARRSSTPDSERASVDAQVCIKTGTGETPYASNISWLLIYADGTSAEPSNTTYNQFEAPTHPVGDRDLPAGRCVRGRITFTAPMGEADCDGRVVAPGRVGIQLGDFVSGRGFVGPVRADAATCRAAEGGRSRREPPMLPRRPAPLSTVFWAPPSVDRRKLPDTAGTSTASHRSVDLSGPRGARCRRAVPCRVHPPAVC